MKSFYLFCFTSNVIEIFHTIFSTSLSSFFALFFVYQNKNPHKACDFAPPMLFAINKQKGKNRRVNVRLDLMFTTMGAYFCIV